MQATHVKRALSSTTLPKDVYKRQPDGSIVSGRHNEMKLEQKNAVVTGAGSGRGLAVAERFAQEGADVAILDLNIGKGTQEAERIAKATGRKVVAYQVDVANKVSVQKAFEAIERDFGAIHIFLNSAGISKIVPFLECSEQLWDLSLIHI